MTLRFHLRKRCLTLLTASALLLGVTLAFAQPPPPGPGGNGPGGPPPFGRPGGPPPFGGPGGPPPGHITATNAPLPVLEAGLKLTDDQKARIAQIQQQFRKQMRAQMPPPPGGGEGGPPDPETMRATMEKGREMEQQTTHLIESVLTSEQKAALPSLLDEIRALQAAGIPLEAYGDLKLSADQRQQIAAIGKKIRQEMDQKRQAAEQSGDFQSMQEAMRSTHQQAHKKVMAVLTDSQRSTAAKFARQHRRPGLGGGFGPPDGVGPPPGGFGPPPGGFGPPPGGFGPPPDGGGPPPGGDNPPPPPDDGAP